VSVQHYEILQHVGKNSVLQWLMYKKKTKIKKAHFTEFHLSQ